MEFSEKMMEYAKYGFSLKKSFAEGREYYMVYMCYGTKWKALEPIEHECSEQNVVCAKVDKDGTYCYMSEVSNGIKPIFDVIDETIRYNEELEKKVELLKEKAEELKELFATRSYAELLGLEFVLKDVSKPEPQKNKRQPKSGKKMSQKPNAEPIGAKSEDCVKSGDGELEIPFELSKPETVTVTVGVSKESEIDKKIAAVLGK
ncbi:MAG: hypothetical protein J6X18_16725 [Bacteroidales bacterium]|nr:hypothetical protein [Bacteroidales bacterium]